MDNRKLYLEALRHNPSDADAFAALGVTTSPGERVKLPDSRTMSQRELYLEALRHNPAYAAAY